VWPHLAKEQPGPTWAGAISVDEYFTRHNYGHVAAIIFSALTVNVAVSCVDDPMVELNESRLFNFVSLVMPMTSTL